MTHPIATALVDSLMACGSIVIYILPLRRREKWKWWLPLVFALMLLCNAALYPLDTYWTLVGQVILFPIVFLAVKQCTELSVGSTCYCAIWCYLTFQSAYELAFGLWSLVPNTSQYYENHLFEIAVMAAVYLLFYCTVARWMPQGEIYQIGPRQLSSAILIGTLYTALTFLFVVADPMDIKSVVIIALCQIQCISLLYLQTELFKKSQMKKDMDAISFLYEREKQQFDLSRQNFSLVRNKCRELEAQIAALQQYLPEQARAAVQFQVDSALIASDMEVNSGNDVLDIVLMEKKLLAEEKRIQITCVADGKQLDFMEVVDIYTLFSNALDNAIQEVSKFQNEDLRLIDVLVHKSQNFLVINISNSLKDPLIIQEGLPKNSKPRGGLRGYGLKMLREAVEKYRGLVSVETEPERFILKVLIPIPRA